MSDQENQRTLCGNFEIAVSLTDRRTFKMTGYVYSDDDAADINKRVDSWQGIMDRQLVRVDIVSKRAQIAGHKANLTALRNGLEELAEKKAQAENGKGKHLTSTEKQAIDNAERTVRSANEQIESLQAAIEAAQKELATT